MRQSIKHIITQTEKSFQPHTHDFGHITGKEKKLKKNYTHNMIA